MCQAHDRLAASERHQELHDRIFSRQKYVHEQFRAVVQKAVDNLAQWHESKEHYPPYDSRPAIVKGELEEALNNYFETTELDHLQAKLAVCESERDAMQSKRDALYDAVKRKEVKLAQAQLVVAAVHRFIPSGRVFETTADHKSAFVKVSSIMELKQAIADAGQEQP